MVGLGCLVKSRLELRCLKLDLPRLQGLEALTLIGSGKRLRNPQTTYQKHKKSRHHNNPFPGQYTNILRIFALGFSRRELYHSNRKDITDKRFMHVKQVMQGKAILKIALFCIRLALLARGYACLA